MQGATATKRLYDSAAFARRYHTDAPLGALWTPQATTFALWAPTARAVVLSLYRSGTGGEALYTLPLARGERGVWRAAAEGDLDGVYYDYTVTDAEGVARRTADPWAVACGRDGARSMVIDLRRTDPENWLLTPPLPGGRRISSMKRTSRIFPSTPASGVPAAYRGKYKAFTLAHTTLHGDGVHPTCVAYLRRLGVTHVQLMPVFDYGSVPEGSDAYNWGYDPVNYNVPDGSYGHRRRRRRGAHPRTERSRAGIAPKRPAGYHGCGVQPHLYPRFLAVAHRAVVLLPPERRRHAVGRFRLRQRPGQRAQHVRAVYPRVGAVLGAGIPF